jgi:hypothetical protein
MPSNSETGVVHPEDAVLPLEEIARRILDEVENE